MPKVAVKIVPWLSEAFGASRTLVLEQEVGEDESPLGLLQKLAERNVSLRGNIFDDSQGGIQGDILIVLNGRLVPQPDVGKIKLRNGDRMTVTPVVTGG